MSWVVGVVLETAPLGGQEEAALLAVAEAAVLTRRLVLQVPQAALQSRVVAAGEPAQEQAPAEREALPKSAVLVVQEAIIQELVRRVPNQEVVAEAAQIVSVRARAAMAKSSSWYSNGIPPTPTTRP